jgi:hypothetical protein
MAAANSRRPSCKCALPIRFVVGVSRSFARPWRRWSTTRASAEATASVALRPPEITPLERYPLNVNDLVASKRVVEAPPVHFIGAGWADRAGSAERGFWLVRYRMERSLRLLEQMLTLTRRESGRINDLSSIIAHSLYR